MKHSTTVIGNVIYLGVGKTETEAEGMMYQALYCTGMKSDRGLTLLSDCNASIRWQPLISLPEFVFSPLSDN